MLYLRGYLIENSPFPSIFTHSAAIELCQIVQVYFLPVYRFFFIEIQLLYNIVLVSAEQ